VRRWKSIFCELPHKMYKKNIKKKTELEPLPLADIQESNADSSFYRMLLQQQVLNKKHKSYEFDGFLKVTQSTGLILDADGQKIGSIRLANPLKDGAALTGSGKEFELSETI